MRNLRGSPQELLVALFEKKIFTCMGQDSSLERTKSREHSYTSSTLFFQDFLTDLQGYLDVIEVVCEVSSCFCKHLRREDRSRSCGKTG